MASSALGATIGAELSQTALDALKYLFLALLFLFLARVVRVVVLELRSPALAGAGGTTGSGGGRASKPGARLRIVEPVARKGETYPLNDELTVGRGGGCGVVLPDDQFVSTVHARLFRRGDDLFVEDLGSRNGTFVNGKPVQAPTRLKRGDRVQFGETVGEVQR
ncbi:MAG: FHA domain-containing protein [Acidimicrobiia bacterium]